MDLSVIYENIGRLVELTDSEKKIFEYFIEVESVNKKSILLNAGSICTYEYFILKGCLRSYYLDKNLTEHTTMFAVEGWWSGNLKSLVKNIPSEFYIVAQEDTTIVRIPKKNIEKIYHQIPKFERYFRILLQNRLLATQDRIGQHLSASAFERYMSFIAKYPELEQRVPDRHIASYLGITPTYLSRLRKKRHQKDFLH